MANPNSLRLVALSQVFEHMNKVMKKFFTCHTNDRVDTQNIRQSKFRQVMTRLCVKVLRRDDLQRRVIRQKRACKHCTRQGPEFCSEEHGTFHHRKNSKFCLLFKPEKDRQLKCGKVLGDTSSSDPESESESGSEEE